MKRRALPRLTKEEWKDIKRRARTEYVSEIADSLGINRAMFLYHCRKRGIVSKKKRGAWNVKHAHLRKPVLLYFQNHSWEETRKKFRLTASQLKSVMTSVYQDPALRHLRKDTRTKEPWSAQEWVTAVRYAGIQNRDWIARKLARGKTGRVIKERFQKNKAGTKFLNGMPVTWARVLIPNVPEQNVVVTNAGPAGGRGDTHFRVIPWTVLERITQRHGVPEHLRVAIRAMAKFQRWIHGTQSDAVILRRFTHALRT